MPKPKEVSYHMPADLAKLARLNRVLPFVGAGVSRHAKLPSGESFLDWEELLIALTVEIEQKGLLYPEEYDIITDPEHGLIERGEYLVVAQVIIEKIREREKAEVIIKDLLDPVGVMHGKIHEWILTIKSPLILTSNYDKLLEHGFSYLYQKSATVFTHKDIGRVQKYYIDWGKKELPAIFKIHGCVDAVDSIIISEDDFRQLIYHSPSYTTFLASLISMNSLLMIGFSFRDPDMKRFLEKMREYMMHTSHYHYICLPKGSITSIEAQRYLADFNLHTIFYNPKNNHEELMYFARDMAGLTNGRKMRSVRRKTARIMGEKEKKIRRKVAKILKEKR